MHNIMAPHGGYRLSVFSTLVRNTVVRPQETRYILVSVNAY